MKSVLVAIAAIAATVVSAQNNILSVTSPLKGTVYTAGKTARISWIKATVDSIPKIMLAKGDPSNLQIVEVLAENVDAKQGYYNWDIPADITPGKDYAIELGESPDLSFSGLFAIENITEVDIASTTDAAEASQATSVEGASSVAAEASQATSVVEGASSVAEEASSVAESAASSAASAATSVAESAASVASDVASTLSSAVA
ncbi:hypothetical protein BD770DRAFT_286263, partial [Pilaira anomala]